MTAHYDPYPQEIEQAEEEEIFQEEAEAADVITVPVKVEGPVRTRDLPAVQWSSHTILIDITTPDGAAPIRIMDANPRRVRAYVYAAGNNLWWLGRTKPEVQSKTCFQWQSGNIIIPIRHTEEVWVWPDAGGHPISWIEEYTD